MHSICFNRAVLLTGVVIRCSRRGPYPPNRTLGRQEVSRGGLGGWRWGQGSLRVPPDGRIGTGGGGWEDDGEVVGGSRTCGRRYRRGDPLFEMQLLLVMLQPVDHLINNVLGVRPEGDSLRNGVHLALSLALQPQ